MKKALYLLLALCVLLMPATSAGATRDGKTDNQISDESTVDIRLQMTLDAYFEMRNDTLSGGFERAKECAGALSALSGIGSARDN